MTNFRNYRSLELDLPPQVTVFQGDNAQGKSNLLEAVYLLATSRSHRTASERELIHWEAASEGWPYSRLVAEVQGARGSLKIEIAFQMQPRGEIREEAPALRLTKRLWINGLPRRASELVGQVKVVLFSSLDIDLVAGSPALRRRFLDGTSCQVDARYLRALQRYQRVLLQRNHLLRLIQEDKASADQLPFWDDELIATGSYITFQRQHLVAALQGRARGIHLELTGGDEELEVSYLCNLGKVFAQEEEARETFRESLAAHRRKELALGVTLAGPHRDDLRFTAGGVDMGPYGSRGQQRTVALSLRLAEMAFLGEQGGEPPLLLLDDVLSELDPKRRLYLLNLTASYQQALITTTDLAGLDAAFLGRCARFLVKQGKVEPLSNP